MLPVLFSHHVEWYHFPVLSLLFAAGFYVGWRFTGPLFRERKEQSGAAIQHAP